MSTKYLTFIILSTSVVIYYNVFPSVLQLCEIETCPNCFGTNMCNEIKLSKITLQYNSLSDLMFNIFSEKNVYFAQYKNRSVVLKKLANRDELKKLNVVKSDSLQDIINSVVSGVSVKHFRLCDKNTATLFLNMFSHKDNRHFQTIIRTNIEPVLLEIFNSQNGWSVPKLYGYCGRLIVVENKGQPLNHVQNFIWFDRAYIAYQILEAINNFTSKHETFRIYLTDISPDNIVVDQNLRVTFIDLESVILKEKDAIGEPHYTEHFHEETYMYSEVQICESSISDHNIYSTCRLILSKEVPWPMMENGLLHSPPKIIKEKFNKLFADIELCVYSKQIINRFQISNNILQNLRDILNNYTNYFV